MKRTLLILMILTFMFRTEGGNIDSLLMEKMPSGITTTEQKLQNLIERFEALLEIKKNSYAEKDINYSMLYHLYKDMGDVKSAKKMQKKAKYMRDDFGKNLFLFYTYHGLDSLAKNYDSIPGGSGLFKTFTRFRSGALTKNELLLKIEKPGESYLNRILLELSMTDNEDVYQLVNRFLMAGKLEKNYFYSYEIGKYKYSLLSKNPVKQVPYIKAILCELRLEKLSNEDLIGFIENTANSSLLKEWALKQYLQGVNSSSLDQYSKHLNRFKNALSVNNNIKDHNPKFLDLIISYGASIFNTYWYDPTAITISKILLVYARNVSTDSELKKKAVFFLQRVLVHYVSYKYSIADAQPILKEHLASDDSVSTASYYLGKNFEKVFQLDSAYLMYQAFVSTFDNPSFKKYSYLKIRISDAKDFILRYDPQKVDYKPLTVVGEFVYDSSRAPFEYAIVKKEIEEAQKKKDYNLAFSLYDKLVSRETPYKSSFQFEYAKLLETLGVKRKAFKMYNLCYSNDKQYMKGLSNEDLEYAKRYSESFITDVLPSINVIDFGRSLSNLFTYTTPEPKRERYNFDNLKPMHTSTSSNIIQKASFIGKDSEPFLAGVQVKVNTMFFKKESFNYGSRTEMERSTSNVTYKIILANIKDFHFFKEHTEIQKNMDYNIVTLKFRQPLLVSTNNKEPKEIFELTLFTKNDKYLIERLDEVVAYFDFLFDNKK